MLSVLFKALNLLFTTHPTESEHGKFPTIMLAYIIYSMSAAYYLRYSQHSISDYHDLKRRYLYQLGLYITQLYDE